MRSEYYALITFLLDSKGIKHVTEIAIVFLLIPVAPFSFWVYVCKIDRWSTPYGDCQGLQIALLWWGELVETRAEMRPYTLIFLSFSLCSSRTNNSVNLHPELLAQECDPI
jgi:hypothetical protein